MAVIFLTGASMSLTFTVGFIYLIELMPKNRQAIVSTVQNIVAVLTVIACALYFAFVSKNCQWFLLIGYCLQLSQIYTLRFVPESPRWLFASQHKVKAINSLQKIAEVNKAGLLSE